MKQIIELMLSWATGEKQYFNFSVMKYSCNRALWFSLWAMTPCAAWLSLGLIKSQFAVAAPSLGKWWGSHRVVWAHPQLPQGHHPHGLRGCPHHHLPHEEPHVLHWDHEETRGMFWVLHWLCCAVQVSSSSVTLSKAQWFRVWGLFLTQWVGNQSVCLRWMVSWAMS